MNVQGIEFKVEKDDTLLVGHAWVGAKPSGTIYAVVSHGEDESLLRKALEKFLSELVDEHGEIELIGLGSDPDTTPSFE